MDALLQRERRHIHLGDRGRAGAGAFQHGLERIVAFAAAVEDEVVVDLLRVRIQSRDRNDFRRVEDGEVQARLHRVVEHERVEDLPGLRREPEAHIGDAEHGEHAGELRLNASDGLQGRDGAGAEFLIPAAEREGERIQDEITGVQPIFAHHERVEPLGDGDLVLDGLRHPPLINGERDDRGAVGLAEIQDLAGLGLAILEVDGVDHALARRALQRAFQHGHLRAVQHERKLNLSRKPLQVLVHVTHFIPAHIGRADVQQVRAFLGLLLGEGDEAIPVLLREQIPKFLRAVRVRAFADDERARFLGEGHGLIEARRAAFKDGSAARRGQVADAGLQRADVLGPRAAATTENGKPEILRGGSHLIGEPIRSEWINDLAALVTGQAGVGQATDGHGALMRKHLEMLAHLLRPRGAVEAQHIHPQRLQAGEHGGDVGAHEQGARRLHRGLHPERHAAFRFGHRFLGGAHGQLDLPEVLAGFDEDRVHAPREQA